MSDPDRCPSCDRSLTRVSVPSAIREHAPEAAAVVGSCPRCLRTVVLSASDADDTADGHPAADASPLTGADPPASIPPGEGGAALLLAFGALDSVALNRPAIEALLDHAERCGADAFLALDRLAADESVDAHADLARRRRQLETMVE
jgi:hypothetical protein